MSVARPRTQVILVDTPSILRDGLAALLTHEECDVVATATNGAEALREAALRRPDLVIIDLFTPTASDPGTITQLKKQHPDLRVLVFTFLREERFIATALRAGADGYVLKSDTRLEFLVALRTILQGKNYISTTMYDQVINGYLNTKGGTQRRLGPGTLSQREREVVRLIAQGYRTREIALQFSRSHKTIEKHRTNLMRKLGLKSAAAVAAYAIAHGYLPR